MLTTVVTTTPIYVCFYVDEHALLEYERLAFKTRDALRPSWLKNMKFPVQIGLANEEGFPHAGVLDFADNAVDRGTGTLRVRGVFDNSKQYLTPGLFVRVRMPFGKPHRALLVAERAIARDQEQKFVWTVNKDNKAEYRQVKVGALLGGLRVIESGIGPDDVVIVNGLQRVSAGKTVAPHGAAERALWRRPPELTRNRRRPAARQQRIRKRGRWGRHSVCPSRRVYSSSRADNNVCPTS